VCIYDWDRNARECVGRKAISSDNVVLPVPST
jgi:hypothetical protein